MGGAMAKKRPNTASSKRRSRSLSPTWESKSLEAQAVSPRLVIIARMAVDLPFQAIGLYDLTHGKAVRIRVVKLAE
jgi:hypothetical protein